MEIIPANSTLETVELITTFRTPKKISLRSYPADHSGLNLNLNAFDFLQKGNFSKNLAAIKDLTFYPSDTAASFGGLFPKAQSLVCSKNHSWYSHGTLALPDAFAVKRLSLELHQNTRVRFRYDQIWPCVTTLSLHTCGSPEVDTVLAWAAKCLPNIETLILDCRLAGDCAWPEFSGVKGFPSLKLLKSNCPFSSAFLGLLLDKAPALALLDAPMSRETNLDLQRDTLAIIPRIIA